MLAPNMTVLFWGFLVGISYKTCSCSLIGMHHSSSLAAHGSQHGAPVAATASFLQGDQSGAQPEGE